MKNFKHPILLITLVLLIAWVGKVVSDTTFSWSGPQATGTLTYKKAIMEDTKLTGTTTNSGDFVASSNLTVNGGNLDIVAAEGANAELLLDADEGDDVGDSWIFRSKAVDNSLIFLNGVTKKAELDNSGNFIAEGAIQGTSLQIDATTNFFDIVGGTQLVFISGSTTNVIDADITN